MPRHSWCFQDRDGATDIILDIHEVHYTSIIVILPNEQRFLEAGGMDVSKWVVVGIPATETEVDAPDSGEVVVYDHNLFMVRPKLNRVYGRF